jgi:hypothetical protein
MPAIITRGAASAKAFGWSGKTGLKIGDAFGGGFFAGQISTTANGIANFNLVVGPAAAAQTTGKQFKTSLSFTTGTDSEIAGNVNSAAENNASHPAAQFCEAVSTGGFTDWYLPANKELEILYYNLKPTTQTNYTGGGSTNNYSVPKRASPFAYSAGDPAQVSVATFQSGGAEAMLTANYYWASTQTNVYDRAYLAIFSDGSSGSGYKTNSLYARAVRRVAV